MSTWPGIAASAVFLGVMTLIVFEGMHLTIAALLGAMLLIFLNVLTLDEAIAYIDNSSTTLVLFFGVMVMVRAFEPTNIFQYLATQMVMFAKGEGKRLLLGIVAITTPICAVLPNATTVMLLAPLIPPIAQELNVNFVPLLILMVFVANSAGLLTLVGDPATFIVGSSINMTFVDYLLKLSLGGAIAIATIVAVLPFLFPRIWHKKLDTLTDLPHPKINHPRMLVFGGAVVAMVLIFYIIGEILPTPVSPATITLLGAALCPLLSHHSKIDSVQNILRDVDWSTLLFFMGVFVLIGALDKTGVLSSAAAGLAVIIGSNIALGSILLMIVVETLSSLIPNIPLVVAMVPMLKEYVVNVGLADASILRSDFTGQLPLEVMPLFFAMMYGATLGGNGTLMGASSNIVAAGIAEQHGRPMSFRVFLSYGIPIAVLQIITTRIYMTVRFLIL